MYVQPFEVLGVLFGAITRSSSSFIWTRPEFSSGSRVPFCVDAGDKANPAFAVGNAETMLGGDLNTTPVANGMAWRAGPGIGRGEHSKSHGDLLFPYCRNYLEVYYLIKCYFVRAFFISQSS